jgi:hypothetical protein
MSGPDLRDVAVMIGTGGVIAHHGQPDRILKPALARAAEVCMSPVSPEMVTDHDYVLAAAGLLLPLTLTSPRAWPSARSACPPFVR